MTELPKLTPETKASWRLEDLKAALDRYNATVIKHKLTAPQLKLEPIDAK